MSAASTRQPGSLGAASPRWEEFVVPLYAIGDQAPHVAADCWVAPSADVIGDVHLGSGVGVWFGAVIRADNTRITIGHDTNVQEGAMLHSDPGVPLTIGAGCTIGHHAILHGCALGTNVLIGMSATVLNGAVIADDCLVGAGALVTEGKSFPRGSLIIGVPARVGRALSDDQIAALRASAATYRRKQQQFADSLRRLD